MEAWVQSDGGAAVYLVTAAHDSARAARDDNGCSLSLRQLRSSGEAVKGIDLRLIAY